MSPMGKCKEFKEKPGIVTAMSNSVWDGYVLHFTCHGLEEEFDNSIYIASCFLKLYLLSSKKVYIDII